MKRILTLSLLISVDAYANLKAPIDLPTATLMPKKIRNLSFKQIYAGATTKYNNSGENVLVSDPLFTDITFAGIAETKRDAAERSAIYQIADSLGKDKNEAIAKTTGQVNIKANATVPVFAYGISSNVTIAVAVPIIKYATNVNSSVDHVDPSAILALKQKLVEKGATDKAAEAIAKLSIDPVGEKLKEYGYKPLANEEDTKLGDIKIVSKYKAKQTKNNLLTVQTELTLPTGEEADIDKAVDVPGGEGQTDFGLFLLNDYSINKYLTFSSKAGYTFQLQDITAKRIPEVKTSTLSPDKDLQTKRDLGDKSVVELALKYKFVGFGIEGGYALQYKDSDSYEGDLYDAKRYDWLEQDTVQNMQTVQLKLSYDTISLFRQKKFAAPLMVNINHTRVIKGKNVVNDPLTSLNLSLFF